MNTAQTQEVQRQTGDQYHRQVGRQKQNNAHHGVKHSREVEGW